jgi:hypothetical protein
MRTEIADSGKDLQLETEHFRAVSGRHHPCEGHRNAEVERVLPHSHGEPRLEQPNHPVPDSKTVVQKPTFLN